MTWIPICCTAAIVSLVGGAPPTAARTGRLATKPRRRARPGQFAEHHRRAAQVRDRVPAGQVQRALGVERGQAHDGSRPTVVTPQVSDQPLQWNMGSVHRCQLDGDSSNSRAMLTALRYAPRWV